MKRPSPRFRGEGKECARLARLIPAYSERLEQHAVRSIFGSVAPLRDPMIRIAMTWRPCASPAGMFSAMHACSKAGRDIARIASGSNTA